MNSEYPFQTCRIVLTVGCILCGLSAGSFLAAQFAPRCDSDDQTLVTGIPIVDSPATDPGATKPEASRLVAAELKAKELDAGTPQDLTFDSFELDAVQSEVLEPDAGIFDVVEPEALKSEAAKIDIAESEAAEPETITPQATAFDVAAFAALESFALESVALEPVALEPVALEPVALEPVALEPVALEPVAAEPVALEPVALEPVALEPVAAEPVAAEPDAAESDAAESDAAESDATESDATELASLLSIEFSADAFAIPAPQDVFGITSLDDIQFPAIPVSDSMNPISSIAPPVPAPWIGVESLAAPSSQSAKRTTDPPFKNDNSRRVPLPPLQAASEPTGTIKIGAMQPVTRTTTTSGNHSTRSDCRECTVPKEAGNLPKRSQTAAPSPTFRRMKSPLSQ